MSVISAMTSSPSAPPRIPADDLYSNDALQRTEMVVDSAGEEILVTYDDGEHTPLDRGTWGGKLEFLLSCIGFAVGLGNVWRFPYLCYKNGGGAFLIPYTACLAFIGLPLFFLEFAFGQFASLGPISIWRISPLFKGVGYAMVIVSFFLAIYYNVIVSHCMFFLVASMTSKLPWSDCNNSWNNKTICIPADGSVNELYIKNNSVKSVSSTEEYFYDHVLNMSDGIDNFGAPSWRLALVLLCAWIICCLVLLKGVQYLGKVSYFTAIFPYIMLTALLIRGCMLPGSWNGILYYITPQFNRLKDPRVWTEAATQIFFSLSCCNGGLIAMSSYNQFKNNCRRDAIIVALINCATSVYAGLVIFANLGFMAGNKGVEVGAVAKSGPGLAFVVYPEALTQMPFPVFWSICFFIMFVTLGLGSQFSIVETVLSGVQDELAIWGIIRNKKHNIIFRILVCVICFLLGLTMVCPGGMYFLQLLDWTVSGFPLLVVALMELFVICKIYGISQFERDIKLMIDDKPNWFWKITWCIISPTLITFLLLFFFINGESLKYDGKPYPAWATYFAYFLAFIPVACIPAVFLWRFCKGGGFVVLSELTKPKYRWGPANPEHRDEFMDVINSRHALTMSDKGDLSAKEEINAGVTRSLLSGINIVGSSADGNDFFQSKTNLAEKFLRVASKEKELNRLNRLGSNSAINSSNNISGSQERVRPTDPVSGVTVDTLAVQAAARDYVLQRDETAA